MSNVYNFGLGPQTNGCPCDSCGGSAGSSCGASASFTPFTKTQLTAFKMRSAMMANASAKKKPDKIPIQKDCKHRDYPGVL